MPDFGFSPDATFPIINGEKGILSLHYDIPGGAAEGDYQLLSFDAGLRENMVPQDDLRKSLFQMQMKWLTASWHMLLQVLLKVVLK